MTAPKSASWAREEAERLALLWAHGDAYAVGDFEAAILAAERRAKEECARIAEEWTRPNNELLDDCCDESQTIACDHIAFAIRSTISHPEESDDR